jgi:hypothetical protein
MLPCATTGLAGLGLCFRNEDGTLIGMVAEVSVDRKTGVVKVSNVWAAIDPDLAVQPDNIGPQSKASSWARRYSSVSSSQTVPSQPPNPAHHVPASRYQFANMLVK